MSDEQREPHVVTHHFPPITYHAFRHFSYHCPLFRNAPPAMAQYVYTMMRVGKVVPPKRSILTNISLSFFPGAKIGVLGLNGVGQVEPAQDHGGSGPGLRRRGGADAEYPHRLPAAGAGA